MDSGVSPPGAGGGDVSAAGSMTSLAIDAFSQIGELSRRRIPVVAEEALVIVGNRPAKILVIGAIVAGAHRPVSALLGVPAYRQLDELTVGRSTQVSTGVIPGAHHKIDGLLDYVGFFAI